MPDRATGYIDGLSLTILPPFNCDYSAKRQGIVGKIAVPPDHCRLKKCEAYCAIAPGFATCAGIALWSCRF
jgi:hypothetical protein